MTEPLIPLRVLLRIATVALVSSLVMAQVLFPPPTPPATAATVMPGEAPRVPESPQVGEPAAPSPEPQPEQPLVAEPVAPPSPEPPAPSPGESLDEQMGRMGVDAASRGSGRSEPLPRIIEPLPSLWSLFVPAPLVWLGAALLVASVARRVRGRGP